jgi:hypothetical protein
MRLSQDPKHRVQAISTLWPAAHRATRSSTRVDRYGLKLSQTIAIHTCAEWSEAQIAAGHELGLAFASGGASVELVPEQVERGPQMPPSLAAGVGGPLAATPKGGRVALPVARWARRLPGWGCRFSGPNSSTQKTIVGSVGPATAGAIGHRVELQNPSGLGVLVRVDAGLPRPPRLHRLKADVLIVNAG